MFQSIITTLLIVLSLYLFKITSKGKSTTDKNGNSIYKLPIAFTIFGILLIILSIIITILIFIEGKTSDIQNIIPVILLFFFIGISILLQGLVNRVTLNSEKITKRNMFGKVTSLYLNQIKSLKFKKFSQYLYIDNGNYTIKCHRYLVGFDEIVEKLANITKIDIEQ